MLARIAFSLIEALYLEDNGRQQCLNGKHSDTILHMVFFNKPLGKQKMRSLGLFTEQVAYAGS